MRIIRFVIFLFFCKLFMSGCVQKSVIDDVNIATGIGMDKSGNQLLGSIMIPG